LWELRRDHVTWSCELRYLGEWRVEAQVLRDGDIFICRTCFTRALAIQWADEQKDHVEKGFPE
jgi:hypothetical protein